MAFEVETVTEIEALLGTGVDDDWDFEAIEMAARRMAMRVAARAVEQRLNDDTSDHAGPTLPCACGQSARYAVIGRVSRLDLLRQVKELERNIERDRAQEDKRRHERDNPSSIDQLQLLANSHTPKQLAEVLKNRKR